MASDTRGDPRLLRPDLEENATENPVQEGKPSSRYALTGKDYNLIADVLDRLGNLQQKNNQGNEGGGAPVAGLGEGLDTLASELLDVLGDIGTYGLLFKLAGYIQQHVQLMQAVDENAKGVAELAASIISRFEGVEVALTISNDVILEEVAQTFSFCALQLRRIQQRKSSGFVGCFSVLSRCLSAPADQGRLDECASKLVELRERLSLALLCSPQVSALPYLEGPSVGIDTQIDELLRFFQEAEEGRFSVVSICGTRGVGKSRLMFEVMHRFPRSPEEVFCLIDFEVGGSVDGTSSSQRLYLQRGLVEHLSGRSRVVSSIHVGKTVIDNSLNCLKNKKKKRVLIAFDNVAHEDDLTSILPLKLSRVLPPGSCILVSLAKRSSSESPALRGVKEVFESADSPSVCRHKVHHVPTLNFRDSRELFSKYATNLEPADDEQEQLVQDIVGRCDGLPLLLQLVAKKGFGKPHTWSDWQKVREELTKADKDIDQVTALVYDLDSQGSLDRKLAVVHRSLGLGLQDALGDLRSLFSGWDFQTVKSILGEERMMKLLEQSLISIKASSAQGLSQVSNLTRSSGPGPWKTELVSVAGIPHAFYQDGHHINSISEWEAEKTIRSICLVDSQEPLHALRLDRAKELRYLILHNTEFQGSLLPTSLEELEFLYWGSDDKSRARFPFHSLKLPKLRIMFINQLTEDHQALTQLPPRLEQLTLMGFSTLAKRLESRNPQELRLKECNLASLRYPKADIHLQVLCWERCSGFKSVPQAIAGLHKLTTLKLLSCEELEQLEEGGVGQLRNLESLNIMNCMKLIKLPEDISKLSKLTYLNLAFCSNLSGEFQLGQGLPRLEELILTGCSTLQSLWSGLGELKSLQKLSLVACSSLEGLPDQINGLAKLEDLAMDFCTRVTTLPQTITDLRSLRRLTLSGCSRLRFLPPGLQTLPNLEHLNLLGARLSYVPDQLIQDLRHNKVVVHVHQSDLRTSYFRGGGSDPSHSKFRSSDFPKQPKHDNKFMSAPAIRS